MPEDQKNMTTQNKNLCTLKLIKGRHVTCDMLSCNAAERCGLFSAVYLLLKQVTCEGQVSVINTVRKVRAARPHALKCQVTPHLHKWIPILDMYILIALDNKLKICLKTGTACKITYKLLVSGTIWLLSQVRFEYLDESRQRIHQYLNNYDDV